MGKRKRIESRGRVGLSKLFKEFNLGDAVAVVKEPSVDSRFPLRIQGSTGIVSEKRGRSYMVEIYTQDKKKKFLIEPAHLKKIMQK
ncbi:MAG TPA: 50S ribosomal protein L21e [Patescibacteria group bacterium]|nr:50S ribosomal protein L21e [Patescibacteria group bacterium]